MNLPLRLISSLLLCQVPVLGLEGFAYLYHAATQEVLARLDVVGKLFPRQSQEISRRDSANLEHVHLRTDSITSLMRCAPVPHLAYA